MDLRAHSAHGNYYTKHTATWCVPSQAASSGGVHSTPCLCAGHGVWDMCDSWTCTRRPRLRATCGNKTLDFATCRAVCLGRKAARRCSPEVMRPHLARDNCCKVLVLGCRSTPTINTRAGTRMSRQDRSDVVSQTANGTRC